MQQVSEEYQQTEVGVIPEDWKVVELGGIGKNLIGLTYSPNDVVEYGTLVLRSSNVQNNKLAFKNNVFVNMELPNRVIVKEGDILICVRNGSKKLIGKCALIDKKIEGVAFGAFMSIYRSEFGSFIFYQFQSNIIQRQIDEIMGATINQITNKDMAVFKVPLPNDAKEQAAIANALSDVDALITSLEKLIAKKRAIKTAAMQQLLTGKKRLPPFDQIHTGFKQTELGEIPQDWEVATIRSIVRTPVTDGPHMTPTFFRSGVPFLSVNNIVDNKIDLTNLRYISKKDDEIFSRKCKPVKNDILLGKAASVGKVAIVEDDLDFNIWSPIALIRVVESGVPKFIYYAFQTDLLTQQIAFLTNSSSQGNIGMGDIERLSFFLPCKDEQRAIAKLFTSIDDEIDMLEQRLNKTQQLKQGMMQELLTGRTRLL